MLDGQLAQVDLAQVLSELGQGSATGGLHLRRPDGACGTIYLRSGQVYAIDCPGLPADLPAGLAALLTWPAGSWQLRLNERTGDDVRPLVPVADLLAALGRSAAGGPRPAGPVLAALNTAPPLVDDVSRSAARAAAALASYRQQPDAALPASKSPVCDGPMDDGPMDDGPMGMYIPAPSWEAAIPRPRPDTDLAALMRELSWLGVEDGPPANRPVGSLMSAAAAHKRRKGPFTRPR